MEQKSEKSLDQVAGNSQRLVTLLKAGRLFDELDRQVQAVLPEQARGQIQVACVEDDCLVLAAASPAWASRARLLADRLLNEVNRQLDPPLRRTRVIVAPKIS
jgi:hypothetical protein